MRETRQSGSEGGARLIPCPYPIKGVDACAAMPAVTDRRSEKMVRTGEIPAPL
jgi:hypothetical protein